MDQDAGCIVFCQCLLPGRKLLLIPGAFVVAGQLGLLLLEKLPSFLGPALILVFQLPGNVLAEQRICLLVAEHPVADRPPGGEAPNKELVRDGQGRYPSSTEVNTAVMDCVAALVCNAADEAYNPQVGREASLQVKDIEAY